MTGDSHAEHNRLLQQAFADEEAVLIRYQTHKLYSVPKIDFPRWVLSRHSWRGDELTLDVGCGPGIYFEGLLECIPNGKLVATDLSAGMIQTVRRLPLANGLDTSVADVQTLPFADKTFDVVLANHVLFLVPDLETALAELHRVLKPDGVLIAATNSQLSMVEFGILMRRAFNLLGHPVGEDEVRFSALQENFSLENGAIKLARRFRAVARHEIPSAFVFTEVQPVVDYIASTRASKEPELPDGVIWDDFLTVMTEQVRRLINHFGELIINKLSGVLIATDSGGFAAEYFSRLNQTGLT
jgi:ubiquinone/menaquinone biosynthesis C-methylase UbiE